jgi:hypothetical protein
LKKIITLLTTVFLLAACGGNEEATSETENKESVKNHEETTEPIEEVTQPTIDTSVFEYATDIEVTDALSTNQHVTVKLTISEASKPGMQVQNIIKQTFDFLQQNDIKEAKTVTILVLQNEKIAQYTVDKEKFVPNESESMVDLVLQASEIEHMSDEVKQHGEALELW